MRADKRKFHIIYKTICKITGRYYYGLHSTDDINDGYIGSGKMLWYSINKYGKEAHETEILEYLPTRESLRLREADIVTSEMIKDPKCMNLIIGGNSNNGISEAGKLKIGAAQKKRKGIKRPAEIGRKISEGKLKSSYIHSEETKNKISQTKKNSDFKLSDEQKEKISRALKGKKKPEGFGPKLSESRKGVPIHNEEARAKISEANKKRKGEKRKPMSEEGKRNIAEAYKNRKTPLQTNAKIVTIDGVEYKSMAAAAIALNVSYGKIRHLISNQSNK